MEEGTRIRTMARSAIGRGAWPDPPLPKGQSVPGSPTGRLLPEEGLPDPRRRVSGREDCRRQMPPNPDPMSGGGMRRSGEWRRKEEGGWVPHRAPSRGGGHEGRLSSAVEEGTRQ